jgi:hypothetical protein
MDSRSAKITKTFTIPLSAAPLIIQTDGFYARQQMDGASLILWSREPPWIQPVSGGVPRQVPHFPDRVIAYVWSPDGKRLALTNRVSPLDVVLFSNFH